jgi:hypothetical protein
MNTKNLVLKAHLKSVGEMGFPLRGRCMEPLLRAGDMARIIPVVNYVKGDIYLFELSSGELALHRLIGVFEDRLMMKGDRACRFEETTQSNIIGVLSEVKFMDSEVWIVVRIGLFQRALISRLSKFLINNRRKNGPKKLKLLARIICKKTLLLYAGQVRKRWDMQL